MFLVGLDIVGDKILEINVFTPGGLWSMSPDAQDRFRREHHCRLENKVAIRRAMAAPSPTVRWQLSEVGHMSTGLKHVAYNLRPRPR